MLQGISTILAFTVLITFIVLIILYYFQFSKHKSTEITRLITVIVFFLTYGIVYDSTRIIIFQFGGSFIEYIDQIGFFIEILLYLFSLAAVYRVISILNRQCGHSIKGDKYWRTLFLGLAAVISAANVCLFQKTPIGTSGFFTYQLHSLLNYLFLFIYVPFFVFLIVRTTILFNEIRARNLRIQIFLSSIFYGIFLFEVYLKNSLFSFFNSLSEPFLIVDLLILELVAAGTIALFIYNSNLLDDISSYFCVRSVYLIKKDAGYVLYGYSFQNLAHNIIISRDQMLLGGFIQAISTGLRITLNLNGNIQILKVGKEFIYFSHGKYLFGVVFSTEANPRIGNRLNTFLTRFEKEYEGYLESWTGLLVNFQSDRVEEWLLKCFR